MRPVSRVPRGVELAPSTSTGHVCRTCASPGSGTISGRAAINECRSASVSCVDVVTIRDDPLRRSNTVSGSTWMPTCVSRCPNCSRTFGFRGMPLRLVGSDCRAPRRSLSRAWSSSSDERLSVHERGRPERGVSLEELSRLHGVAVQTEHLYKESTTRLRDGGVDPAVFNRGRPCRVGGGGTPSITLCVGSSRYRSPAGMRGPHAQPTPSRGCHQHRGRCPVLRLSQRHRR